MTIGSMFSDILKSFFQKPVTEKYPFERHAAPENLRGKVIWNPENCSGCMLCVKDCPSDALELMVIDKVNKRFVMRYHLDRCTYCSQCMVSCRFKCIDLSDDQWELASFDKRPFEIYYGKEEDVRFLMEKAARGDAEPGCNEPDV